MEDEYDFYNSTLDGPESQLKISCSQRMHMFFKKLTIADPLSQLKISCSQRLHMVIEVDKGKKRELWRVVNSSL